MALNATAKSDGKGNGEVPVGGAKPRGGRIRRARQALGNASRLLLFSGRLALGRQGIVLLVAAVGVFAGTALSGAAWTAQHAFNALLLTQTVFFVVLTMGLLPREKEWRTLEVLLVNARSAHRLVLIKFLPVCVFVLAVGLALTIGYYWFVEAFSPATMLLATFGLAATVGVFTLLLTTYLRNPYAAGVAALVTAVVISTTWIDPWEAFHGDLVTVRMTRGESREGFSEPEERRYSGGRGRGPRRDPPGRRGRDSRGDSDGGHSGARPKRDGGLTANRILLIVLFGFLYDHTVRRMRRLELWMR